MNNIIITEIEQSQMKEGVVVPRVGDTVSVSKVIVEGKKERVQKFEGVVIKVQGKYSRTSITVRKIVDKVGVEKSFLVHSPLVPKLEILKEGKVRRARLYYLRDRIGAKANRVKTRAPKPKAKA